MRIFRVQYFVTTRNQALDSDLKNSQPFVSVSSWDDSRLQLPQEAMRIATGCTPAPRCASQSVGLSQFDDLWAPLTIPLKLRRHKQVEDHDLPNLRLRGLVGDLGWPHVEFLHASYYCLWNPQVSYPRPSGILCYRLGATAFQWEFPLRQRVNQEGAWRAAHVTINQEWSLPNCHELLWFV